MSKIRFTEAFLAGNELDFLAEVLASKNLSGNGPFGKKVQRLLADHTHAPHVLLTHSCTGALELAAMLHDLGPGDEVLMPSFTFVSTATAFLRTGAKPVFCEVDPATMTLDPADVRQRLTARTRAIVPVHYAGIGADMGALTAIAAAAGVALIEDAAQGLDAYRDGRHLGTFGSLGTLSFHETKNIHCGLGGALIINDPKLFDRAETIWERGTDRSRMHRGLVAKYSWVDVGSSFCMTELQAAFLWGQLQKLRDNTEKRQQQWQCYWDHLSPLAARGAFTLPQIPPSCQTNSHAFFLLARSMAEADRLRLHLAASDIQAVIHFVPLHDSAMGEKLGYRPEDLPITMDTAHRLLRLPLHDGLGAEDLARVCAAIAAFF